MASQEDVFQKLKSIVVEQLGVDEEDVTMESSFVDDLNADSLDLVELIMSLEEEFGLEISDEEAENISTVSDAVEFVACACNELAKRLHLCWTQPSATELRDLVWKVRLEQHRELDDRDDAHDAVVVCGKPLGHGEPFAPPFRASEVVDPRGLAAIEGLHHGPCDISDLLVGCIPIVDQHLIIHAELTDAIRSKRRRLMA